MAQGRVALSKIAGGNLAHMLWQRRISQKKFAVIVGRTPRTVRRWMYEGIPTLDDLQAITEALGVSVMDILSDSEDVHCFARSEVNPRLCRGQQIALAKTNEIKRIPQ